jgi:NADH dehydrogenase
VINALNEPSSAGRTYELGGPQIYSFKALLQIVLRETRRHRLLLPLPVPLALLIGMLGELLPVPPLTRDQVAQLQVDNVVANGAAGLADLGIVPTTVEAVVPSYLTVYRRGGQYTTYNTGSPAG